MSQLAHIETEALVFDLSGDSETPIALVSRPNLHIAPHFIATRSGDPLATSGTPALYEERDYLLVVRDKAMASLPVVTFRDPTVVTQRTAIAEVGTLSLRVRFRGQVGRTTFTLRVGEEELVLEAEIFPSKLDYVEDYEELLDDVARVRRALTLEYLRATYRSGRVNRDERGSGIEWLTLLRQFTEELREAIQQINASPRRALVREDASTPLHRVRGSSAGVTRAVARGLGTGDFENVPDIGPVRSRIQASRAYESLDTLEHRWLRARLRSVHARLNELEVAQAGRVAGAMARTGKRPPRLIAELQEIRDLRDQIGYLLRTTVIAAATVDVPASLTSIQLQSAIGYGQAYRALTILSAALENESGNDQFSTSDLNELYETWCFLKVAQLTAELLGTDVDFSELIPADTANLRFSLHKGVTRSVKLAGKFVQAALSYNPAFDVPTGIQMPDVVLRVAASGGVDFLVVLDAKYRVDGSPEYVQQFGAPGAPVDAVNQLHRYRDAIQVEDAHGDPIKPVAAGIALFPWPAAVPGYRLRDAASEVGIGAIPLLPGNDDGLRAWLIEIFEAYGLTVVSAASKGHLHLVG